MRRPFIHIGGHAHLYYGRWQLSIGVTPLHWSWIFEHREDWRWGLFRFGPVRGDWLLNIRDELLVDEWSEAQRQDYLKECEVLDNTKDSML